MMKFKRWKKMIVMLIVATMFLQSVVVYADDGSLTPVVETETETPTTTNDESMPAEAPGATTPDGMPAEIPDTITSGGTPAEAPGAITSGGTMTEAPDVTTPEETIPGILSDETTGNLTIETTGKVNDLNGEAGEELLETEPVNEEIPAEIQAFLDAVAKLPEASEITVENAADVMEQLYDETLSDGYGMVDNSKEVWADREDVKAACAKYEAVFAAAEAALELWKSTFEAGGDSLFSRIYNIYSGIGYENFVDELEYGDVELEINVGVGETWTDSGVLKAWNHGDIYEVNSWDDVSVWSTNPNVLKVTTSKSGKTLSITYEGIADGTASVRIAFNATTRSTGQYGVYGPDISGGAAVSGRYAYGTVTVGTGTAKPIDKPKAPNFTNRDPLYVYIQCQENPGNHNTVSNVFADSRKGADYIASDDDVVENSGTSQFPASTHPYKCPVSLNTDYFMNLWNTNFSASQGTHYLYETPKTIMFYYEAASGKWKCSTNDLVQFYNNGNVEYGWLMKINKKKEESLSVIDDIYVPANGVDNGVMEIQWGYNGTPAVFALSNRKVTDNTGDSASVNVTQSGNYIYVDVTGQKSTGTGYKTVVMAYNASYSGTIYKITETIRVHVYETPSKELNAGASETYGYIWGPGGVDFEMLSNPEAIGNVTVSNVSTNSNGTYKVTARGTAGSGKVKSTYVWAQGKDYLGTGLRVDVRDFTVKASDKTYTVTYTDGVEKEEVFVDQKHENLTAGDTTPAFATADFGTETVNGKVQPKRDGYTFMGWSPAVAAKVNSNMADADGNIVYTATWSKNLTVSKTPSKRYPVVGEEFFYTIKVQNSNSKAVTVKIIDVLNEKLTFVAAGDGGTHSGGTAISGSNETKGGTVTWNNIEVPANGNKEIKLYVKANAAGEIKNEAKIESEINEASGNTTVEAKAKPATYTVYHEYYTNGERDGHTDGKTVNGTVGQTVKVEDIEKVLKYQDKEGYAYTRANKGISANNPDGYTLGSEVTQFTLIDGANIVVLRYDRTSKKPPKMEVKKVNSEFNMDPESGNAKVDYTVTIKNVSGFDIYGLKVTDTLTPTLTKKGNSEGAPSATYTFSNWKVGGKGITPISGKADELTHELGLLPRNTIFKDDQTVTLTYTVEIETNNVPAAVKLENTADVDSWSNEYTPSKLAKVAAFFGIRARTADDDIGYPDDPDIHGSGSSSTGGDVSGSSETEGELPAKYSLTYDWNLPDGAAPSKTLPTEARTEKNGGMPAGAHFTVDTVNKKGDEVTGSDGKTYVFSGWVVPDTCKTETEEGQYKGQYIMPKGNVVITGEWREKVEEHTVTVRYMCGDSNTPFRSDTILSYPLAKGETYNHIVDDNKTSYVMKEDFGPGVLSPKKFTFSSGTTYVFDEVLTTDALTGRMGDEDIVIEVWYSRDNKGNIGTDGTDTSDGIPDRYQVKVIFKVENGSWDDETTDDVVKYVEKYGTDGKLNAKGEATLGNIIPKVGNEPATGFEAGSWDTTPTENTKITKDTVYTYFYEKHVHDWQEKTDDGGHTVWADGKAPDCIHDGTAVYECSTCKETKEEVKKDSALGHDFKDAEAQDNCDSHEDADCTGHTLTCTRCNGELKDGNEKKTENHTYGEWTTTKKPTATERGEQERICSACGHKETKEIAALGEVTITVKFVDEEGNEVGSEDKIVTKGSEYDVTEEAEKIPEGYEPDDSRTADSVTGTADSDKTVNVPVKRKQYTVTYTDGVEGTEVFADQTNTVKHGELTPAFSGTPTRNGYVFAGWTPTVAATVTGNVIYTAQWDAVYTVTYTDGVEGTEIFADQVTSDLRNGATTPAFSGTPTRAGYTFAGWTPTVTATVTGNATYTAQWTAVPVTPTPTPDPGPTPGGGGTPDPTPTPGPEPTPIVPEPVPLADPVPTVTPAVTPVAPTPTAAAPAAEAAEADGPTIEALEDEEVPLAAGDEEEAPELAALNEEEVPLAPGKGASWALINFALMNLAIFESLMLLIGYFTKTKNDEEERKLKKKGLFRILSIPVAVISLIAFILTEDITLPTGFVDKYTIVMLIIAVVQTVMVVLSNKKYEDEEEA